MPETTNQTLNPDICVIGAGAGGLTVAAGAAMMGASVVLVEQGRMGGDCLNHGCVPSKALLAAAKQAEAMRQGTPFGIAPHEPGIDFAKVHAHVRGVIASIAPNDSAARFTGLGVRVIKATARFTGPTEVAAGDMTIRARRFVIATGSRPGVPAIPGLDTVAYLTNETIFDLDVCPDHLIILGGGPIGCELAQGYRRLGARVTMLALAFLEKDDPELSAVVLDTLETEGISLSHVDTISAIGMTGRRITVTYDRGGAEYRVEGSHILAATGRQPNITGLGLDMAGVSHDQAGIQVDARLRTTNRRIHAIGDCAGGPQFTHVANYHAGIVLRNSLFRLRAKVKSQMLPAVIYTDPELAHVGWTEAEARRRRGNGLVILRWPLAENDRAQADRQTHGMIKVITTRRGAILGTSIVAPHAGDLIQPWCLALAQGLKIAAMASYIAPYPTLGEISKRAAGTFFTASLFGPRIRSLVRFLSKFG